MAATLLDLITHLRTSILDDRGGDRADPDAWITDDSRCKWKNRQLTGFLNEAAREYCRIVGVWDSGVWTATLPAGERYLALPEYVEEVEGITGLSPYGEGWSRITARDIDTDPGQRLDDWLMHSYAVDMEHRRIRFVGQVSTTPLTLTFRVKRLPATTPFSWDDYVASTATVLPYPTDLWDKLVLWAAFLAFSVPDADLADPGKAGEYRARWLQEVGPPESAHIRQWRARNTAGRPPHRARAWGA